MPHESRGSLLAAILFTDIVGATDVADGLGDRRWRELLARHHAIVRRELKRFNGRELDTAGDGFFAAFTRPAEAIRSAAAIVDGVRELGIEVRAGLHVGEAEIFGAKLSGVTVHIAARTMAETAAGEILVTGVLKDLVPGSGFSFEDRGLHQLKGVPGEWRLFALTAVDGVTLPPPVEPAEQRERLETIQPPMVPRRARIPLLGVGAGLVLAALIAALVVGLGRGGRAASPPVVTSEPEGLLVAIDPASRKQVAAVPLEFTPGPVAYANGSIWIVDGDGDRVLRVDAGTRRIEARIPVGKEPVEITTGGGAVWVANHFGRSVSRIDPGSNRVVTVKVDFQPLHIAAGERAVWVSDDGVIGPSGPISDLATIEPFTFRVIHQTKLNSPCAPVLSKGTTGGWAATASGQIWRIDDLGNKPVLHATTSSRALAGMLVDEGTEVIWLGADGSPGNVMTLDPLTKELSDPIPVGTTRNLGEAGCNPIWIARGGSYLWVTNSDDRSLSVIAEGARQLVDTMALRGRPSGLASGADRVWVTIDLP